MQEKYKEIIATFIRIPAQEIGAATPIDRSAVKSSIMLHRMYARLAAAGLTVGNYAAIKVYGDLIALAAPTAPTAPAAPTTPPTPADAPPAPATPQDGSIGIDIEEIAALPRTTDFRKEEFYKMNFTSREIAYCILQPDPYASFAGLFAAKEAMVKADNTIRDRAFHTLEITHTPEGKPAAPGFAISISHTNGTAVAVATPAGSPAAPMPALTVPPAAPAKAKNSWLLWIAVLLSITALLLAILH